MGIIKAGLSAAGGALADQWLEVIEAVDMDNQTIITKGEMVNRDAKRNQNKKGTSRVISDGSVIHVSENQFMLLTDGGKIVDYSAEPGYYIVETGSAPSMFNGQLSESLQDAFDRIKFGGTTPASMQVYYVNLQEIKDIPFGTPSPLNYFDNFYNAELYLRANGYYSVRVVNPIQFYSEMGSREGTRTTAQDFQKSLLAEFLTAFQTAIGEMSVQGERISHVGAQSTKLAAQISSVLEESWTKKRGLIVESVGINAITYDDNSKKLIDMRNQGAMLSDPLIREGYVQGAVARGMEAAGSNSSGAVQSFMGMNAGMQQAGSFMAAASSSNQQAVSQQSSMQNEELRQNSWQCQSCSKQNSGKFCDECGAKRPSASFCPECGKPSVAGAKFCQECGTKIE